MMEPSIAADVLACGPRSSSTQGPERWRCVSSCRSGGGGPNSWIRKGWWKTSVIREIIDGDPIQKVLKISVWWGEKSVVCLLTVSSELESLPKT